MIFVPFLSKAFSFAPITLTEYLIAMGLALLIIPVVEIQKAIYRGTHRPGKNKN